MPATDERRDADDEAPIEVVRRICARCATTTVDVPHAITLGCPRCGCMAYREENWFLSAKLVRTLCSQGEEMNNSQDADDEAAEIARLRAEIADLKISVISFCALFAPSYAAKAGLPPGHLHPAHYDILAKAGARMDVLTRAEVPGYE